MERATGIYARVIFPDAFSKTDPHLSDLQKAMLDARPDCIKVLSVDGKLLTMNRAGCLALNVPEESKFGMPWLPLLPEDVRQLGMEALQKAAQGHSARFPGRSESPAGLIAGEALAPQEVLQQRAERAAEIGLVDREALELMRALRKHTFGAIGDGPHSVSKRALQAAIDDMAGVITGNREYFSSGDGRQVLTGPRGSE
jgi:PAS domain-containing protein